MFRALQAGLLAAGVSLAWMLGLPAPGVKQPIAFNHARHDGVLCAVCHAGARESIHAGLPALSTCVKCHATAPASAEPARWDALVRAGRVDWEPVTRVPSHVWFSHRRHVGIARLECRSCHGDIATRTRPPERPLMQIEMKTCLRCHQQEAANQDCAGCHR